MEVNHRGKMGRLYHRHGGDFRTFTKKGWKRANWAALERLFGKMVEEGLLNKYKETPLWLPPVFEIVEDGNLEFLERG